MKHQEFLEKLADYLDDLLSDDEKTRFEEHLASCPSCKTLHKEYRSISKLELIAAKSPMPKHPDISQSVMQKITRHQVEESIYQELWGKTRKVVLTLASVNILALLAITSLLYLRTANSTGQDKRQIRAINLTTNTPHDRASHLQTISYRGDSPSSWGTVSFTLGSTEAIKYFANPRTFVDVRLQFTDSGGKNSLVLGRFLKVVAVTSRLVVDPLSKAEYVDNEVTVLVPIEDVERINKLRIVGQVSLLPIVQNHPHVKTLAPRQDPSGRSILIPDPRASFAVMYPASGRTSKDSRLVFTNGKWQEEKLEEILVF